MRTDLTLFVRRHPVFTLDWYTNDPNGTTPVDVKYHFLNTLNTLLPVSEALPRPPFIFLHQTVHLLTTSTARVRDIERDPTPNTSAFRKSAKQVSPYSPPTASLRPMPDSVTAAVANVAQAADAVHSASAAVTASLGMPQGIFHAAQAASAAHSAVTSAPGPPQAAPPVLKALEPIGLASVPGRVLLSSIMYHPADLTAWEGECRTKGGTHLPFKPPILHTRDDHALSPPKPPGCDAADLATAPLDVPRIVMVRFVTSDEKNLPSECGFGVVGSNSKAAAVVIVARRLFCGHRGMTILQLYGGDSGFGAGWDEEVLRGRE
ncbi:hypothetical protein B0H13DRAFT_2681890 [Mycena leptocephala]|nr:hypothetical protein B0H13DRAFT_2681890 [Mycena leptocephala]